MANGLHRIRMEQHAALPAYFPDLGDGHDRADLVVCEHDGNKDGLVRYGICDLFRRDHAVFIHRQVGDFDPALLKRLAGVQDRMMLHIGGDDVVALALVAFRHAKEHRVVAFRAAAGEDDLLRQRIERLCHLIPRMLHAAARFLPERMRAGGVAVNGREIWHHLLKHFGGKRCCGRIVKVDFSHSLLKPSFRFSLLPRRVTGLIFRASAPSVSCNHPPCP